MKLISLEDNYDNMAIAPLYPEKKSGCSSCGKKGININITNTANGNTASGNSGSSANNDNANTQRSSQPQASTIDGGGSVPARVVKERPVQAQNDPRPADKTESVLNKILTKLNEPRPVPSSIATEKKPDNVKVYVRDREVKVPVERRVNYMKPQEINIERDRQVPYVRNQENTVERERIKTEVIEREIPRVYDRIKKKILVIRANQPPAPPSFA